MLRTVVLVLGMLAALGTAALGTAGLATAAAGNLERAQAAYYRGDYAEAMQLMMPLAEDGDRHAQFLIGFMHERGQGMPKDYEKAAEWYARAADQGHPNAQNNLGVLYKYGRGVPKDYARAYSWFGLAAEHYLPAEFGHKERALLNQQDVAAMMTTEQLVEGREHIEAYQDDAPGIPEYRAPNIR
ncbi:MAG: tetratricopeptide repeat protein [Pseudomonadota bacterium]